MQPEPNDAPTISEVRVVPFDDRHRDAFRDLNLAWIEARFDVEERDHRQLSDPRANIIDAGGAIFIAEIDARAVGTCAMVFVDDACYELAKMTVIEEARGRGIGERLLCAAIEWARERGASRITLLSHSSLRAAIGLYRKHGFRPVPLGDVGNSYDVCDIAMRLDIAAAAAE